MRHKDALGTVICACRSHIVPDLTSSSLPLLAPSTLSNCGPLTRRWCATAHPTPNVVGRRNAPLRRHHHTLVLKVPTVSGLVAIIAELTLLLPCFSQSADIKALVVRIGARKVAVALAYELAMAAHVDIFREVTHVGTDVACR